MMKPISRRTLLRGVGVAISLPSLEAMSHGIALADAATTSRLGSPPKRLAFLYVPNGVHMKDWTPTQQGSSFELPSTLQSLSAFKNDLMILTNLAQDNAHAKGDGGGDHARSLACFLTGTHPKKTDGANIKAGVSVDQVAAAKIGVQTRFPSLELGIERGGQSGNCDSGYSCAYSSNIAWRSESQPVPKEINPRLVFERLFAARDSGPAAVKRDKLRRSVLDFVAEDAQSLKTRLGRNDQRKVDEYLTAVRELEVRLARAGKPIPASETLGLSRPNGVPEDYQEHIRLMFDLMAMAFQTDSTRISTFMFANEGSNRSYQFLGAPEGHHDLSHHGNDPEKHEKIKKINTFHVQQLAYFLNKLKAMKEADDKSVLEHSMIVYGSGISDGNRHNHNELPIILAGGGGGTIKPGRHVIYPENTPLNNLYLSLLDRLDVKTDSLGDSTGRLNSLEG